MLAADTMAVVVGIEDYQAGKEWRLDGPALDACRFARWLTTRGVPADRITLLVSPLPENADAVKEQSQGYRVRAAADHVTVRDVFTRYLPRETSSLLILYWGGHGVIEEEERRLFYADATSMDRRNLNLSSLLKSMRSSTFARHPQQLGLVDACLNLVTDLGWKGRMTSEVFSEGPPEPQRDQRVLLAASPGERATNVDALKTGLFSQVLREALDTLPEGTWPPDADWLRDFVNARFGRLRDDEHRTQQVPSYLWFRSRSGEDTLVFASGSQALLPAPVLDVPVRGRDGVIEGFARLAPAPDGRVHVLTGLGGAGKSTAARAVAARIAADGGRVWWVPAASAVVLTQLLLGLAGDLGALPGQMENAMAGRVNPSDVLWQQLEASPGWTLILDNADDLAALAVGGREARSGSGWLRQSRAGLVVVTSRVRDRSAWGPVAEIHPLKPLSEEDGSQVLLDLAPAGGDEKAARSLSKRLGGLPLALHHAGSYLSSPFATETSFAGYERALSARFAELMSRGDDDRAKVIATWELSMAALEAQGAAQARPLLRVLSCFASPAPVPALLLDREVLTRMCGTVTRVEDGLSGLLSVGLIDIVDATAGIPRDVKVHHLVAETIRYRAGKELLASLEEAVKLLAAATSRLDERDPRHADRWLAVLPHLQALQLSEVQLPAQAEASLAQAACAVSRALVSGGRYAAALDLAESGLQRGHGLPGAHPTVLRLRERRAFARKCLGRNAEAENEYRQVLDARLRVLGPDHPDTLTTRHEIAVTLGMQGQLAEAEAEFRQVLAARLQVLEPDHPDTLSTRHCIAAALGLQGKHAQAEAESRQVLDAKLRVLEPDHPETLHTRFNIAVSLMAQGRAAEAEDEFRQVLDARLQVLGPDHPDTLLTRRLLEDLSRDRGGTA